eukprot:440357-Prymnesium_polylepis.1
MFEAKLKGLEAQVMGSAEEWKSARQAEGTLASQLVSLQQELRARAEELAASQAEARRQGVLVSTSRQECELARAESGRLREELGAQASSKVQLQQLLERMHEMQVREARACRGCHTRLNSVTIPGLTRLPHPA